ncbi:MAG TPA: ATP-binding protein [Bacteroidales bacterium]|nr:ATP-binding protein [Bacteroidales bacterium]
MKFQDSKNIARNVTVITTVSVFASVYISGMVAGCNHIIPALAGSLISLPISFFFTNYLINKQINEKIRVIYKTIHQQKTEKGNAMKFPDPESIDRVNKEVLEWSTNKKAEIDKLKELENYRREYIGNISHELKTPIFNIQGYVLTLLDGGLDDPQINKDYLLRTEKSINRMIAIIEDLETITQLETNELKINLSKFDLAALAIEVVESLEMKAEKKGMTIYFAQPHDNPIWVKADRDRIAQVLTNLIENAIKYGKKGDGRIKISFFDMDENILAEVTDNGPGIAQQDLGRIFERFYRTDKARSREQGGTGLGLAIVKHIMEAHEQTVNVRSTLGIGTTFGFTLERATNRT